jgi:hypothetical protein
MTSREQSSFRSKPLLNKLKKSKFLKFILSLFFPFPGTGEEILNLFSLPLELVLKIRYYNLSSIGGFRGCIREYQLNKSNTPPRYD